MIPSLIAEEPSGGIARFSILSHRQRWAGLVGERANLLQCWSRSCKIRSHGTQDGTQFVSQLAHSAPGARDQMRKLDQYQQHLDPDAGHTAATTRTS